jgi:hypothetical protein
VLANCVIPWWALHLVTFYQQLVLRKPLNHQLLEIIAWKYSSQSWYPYNGTTNPNSLHTTTSHEEQCLQDLLLTEISIYKDAFVSNVASDLICLETDAMKSHNNVEENNSCNFFLETTRSCWSRWNYGIYKLLGKSISLIDVVLISKDSFVVFKNYTYMFNVVIAYNLD